MFAKENCNLIKIYIKTASKTSFLKLKQIWENSKKVKIKNQKYVKADPLKLSLKFRKSCFTEAKIK